MNTLKTLPEIPDEDTPPIRWAPWLTHRRLILFVIGWLVLFALLSFFVSNPFQSETSASATPDYAQVMFLLPTIVLVMLAVELLVKRGHPSWIGWTAIIGTTITFVGGLVYVFVTPTLYGPGYVLSTVGLVVVGVALLATIWWGVLGAIKHSKQRLPVPVPAQP